MGVLHYVTALVSHTRKEGFEETHELDLSAWHADSTLTDLQHSIIHKLGLRPSSCQTNVEGAFIERVDGCLDLDPQYDAPKAMRRYIILNDSLYHDPNRDSFSRSRRAAMHSSLKLRHISALADVAASKRSSSSSGRSSDGSSDGSPLFTVTVFDEASIAQIINEDRSFHVNVKTMTGKTYTLRVRPSTTIKAVKERLQDMSGDGGGAGRAGGGGVCARC